VRRASASDHLLVRLWSTCSFTPAGGDLAVTAAGGGGPDGAVIKRVRNEENEPAGPELRATGRCFNYQYRLSRCEM
jgi:hypothetical protein